MTLVHAAWMSSMSKKCTVLTGTVNLDTEVLMAMEIFPSPGAVYNDVGWWGNRVFAIVFNIEAILKLSPGLLEIKTRFEKLKVLPYRIGPRCAWLKTNSSAHVTSGVGSEVQKRESSPVVHYVTRTSEWTRTIQYGL